ncbi:hypothetical protein [Marinobacter daqiaonensis]|uniref:hypothetical protein n=1 Tax=Marinobacter daqiaonensis TaxID=650891 RepID=UPI001114058A|nr:hypothetical protein [Marinobacter daqiaonensis]
MMDQAENINLDSWNLPGNDMQRQTWAVPPRKTWRVENKFRQTSGRGKTSTLFKRFNGHYLSIKTHRRRKELPEQVIDLTFVEPTPREVKDYRYALWFFSVCLLILPASVYSLVPFSPLWLGVPVVVSLILMLAAVCLRRHRFDFLALNSDVVLFYIDALATDQEKVTAFIETVCDGIARGQRQLPVGKQRIPLAVVEMRRLAGEGVITSGQYETIKRNWFSL